MSLKEAVMVHHDDHIDYLRADGEEAISATTLLRGQKSSTEKQVYCHKYLPPHRSAWASRQAQDRRPSTLHPGRSSNAR